jgi:hypothetical protein
VSAPMPLKSLLTVLAKDCGDDVMHMSSYSSETMVGIKLILSALGFPNRHRACASNLDDGAFAKEEAEEIEDERDDRELSDTIDSGDDAVDIELASEDRRVT